MKFTRVQPFLLEDLSVVAKFTSAGFRTWFFYMKSLCTIFSLIVQDLEISRSKVVAYVVEMIMSHHDMIR